MKKIILILGFFTTLLFSSSYEDGLKAYKNSDFKTALLIFVGIFILDYFSNIYEHNESKEMLEMYFKKHTFEEKLKSNLNIFNQLNLELVHRLLPFTQFFCF